MPQIAAPNSADISIAAEVHPTATRNHAGRALTFTRISLSPPELCTNIWPVFSFSVGTSSRTWAAHNHMAVWTAESDAIIAAAPNTSSCPTELATSSKTQSQNPTNGSAQRARAHMMPNRLGIRNSLRPNGSAALLTRTSTVCVLPRDLWIVASNHVSFGITVPCRSPSPALSKSILPTCCLFHRCSPRSSTSLDTTSTGTSPLRVEVVPWSGSGGRLRGPTGQWEVARGGSCTAVCLGAATGARTGAGAGTGENKTGAGTLGCCCWNAGVGSGGASWDGCFGCWAGTGRLACDGCRWRGLRECAGAFAGAGAGVVLGRDVTAGAGVVAGRGARSCIRTGRGRSSPIADAKSAIEGKRRCGSRLSAAASRPQTGRRAPGYSGARAAS